MDPISQIQNAALNPTVGAAASPQKVQAERKSKGLCITCGVEKTHEKKKWSTSWKPIGDEICFQQHLCLKCWRKKQDRQLRSSEFTRRTSSNSGSFVIGGPPAASGESSSTHMRSLVGQLPGLVDASYHNKTTSLDEDTTTSSSSASFASNQTFTRSLASAMTRESTIGGGHYQIQNKREFRSQQPTTPGGRGSNSKAYATMNTPAMRMAKNRQSCCSRLSVLPDSVWKVRADETLQEPKESLIFPKHESLPAARNTRVTVLDNFDVTQKKMEVMHVVQLQNGRPHVAFRRLTYPPPSKIPFGRQLFCTKLQRTVAGGGFEEPSLRHKWSSMVLVKEIEKQSYYGLDANDSPLKDAVVLQQVGGGLSSAGILNCTHVLEDDHYLYLICPMDRYQTLGEVGLRHPRLQQNSTKSRQQEELSIKPLFRQLVRAVQQTHMYGLCHRNLDPKLIFLLSSEGSTPSATSKSSKTIVLSDFCCSLLVPNTTTQRYLMTPGISGGSNRRYMAPEVYHYQVYDGMAADMWSLGVILFELLTGCKLHAHPTRMDPVYCFFVLHSGFLTTGNELPQELLDRMQNNNSSSSGLDLETASLGPSQQMMDLTDSISAVRQLSLHARNLLTDLLQEFPPNRLSIQEVLNHPWFSAAAAASSRQRTVSQPQSRRAD